ncbi:MAG: type II toxin-antitoxin system VapC family toxin [Agarilytica sp.]
MKKGKRFLLDTNVLSSLIRNPQNSKVIARIEDVGEDNVFTSIIVAGELRFGAKKRGSKNLSRQVETVLSTIDIEPFEEPADNFYADIRCVLESVGTPIGPNDLLIAAHALALNTTIVTANTSEFCRVSGLVVENWL